MRDPWADAGGEDAADGRRVILKVTVEVSEEESDTILVRDGDDADDLARRFCSRHGLQQSLSDPLANHIYENILKVMRDSGADEPSVPAPPPDLAGPRACLSPRSRSASATPRRSSGGGYGYGTAGATASGAESPRFGQADHAMAPRTPPPRGAPGSVRAARRSAGGYGGAVASSGSRGATQRGMAASAARPRNSRTCGGSAACGRPEASPCSAAGDAGSGGGAGGRFELLYKDATNRRLKLDRLRKQVECEADSWRRFPEEACSLGDRLHRDAAQRQLKIETLRTQRNELRRQEEGREATFCPAIGASQRRCPGASRVPDDPADRKTKMKIAGLREMKEKKALDGCTFRPEVDHRSQALYSQRVARTKAASMHECLYDDALRRRGGETMRASCHAFPPDAASADPCRTPSGDDTKENQPNHLAHSSSHPERRSARWCPQHQESHCSQDAATPPQRHAGSGMRPRSAGTGGPRVLQHRYPDLALPGAHCSASAHAASLSGAAAAIAAAAANQMQTPRRSTSAVRSPAATPTAAEEAAPPAMASTPSVTTIPAPNLEAEVGANRWADRWQAPRQEPVQAWPSMAAIGVIDLVGASMPGGAAAAE